MKHYITKNVNEDSKNYCENRIEKEVCEDVLSFIDGFTFGIITAGIVAGFTMFITFMML